MMNVTATLCARKVRMSCVLAKHQDRINQYAISESSAGTPAANKSQFFLKSSHLSPLELSVGSVRTERGEKSGNCKNK